MLNRTSIEVFRAFPRDASAFIVDVDGAAVALGSTNGHVASCAWGDGADRTAHSVSVRHREGPQAFVFGAHDECDVVIPGACLRHVLVLCWPDGAIEAIDLRTGMGLGLNGRRVARVLATGCMHITVGDADVVVSHVHPEHGVEREPNATASVPKPPALTPAEHTSRIELLVGRNEGTFGSRRCRAPDDFVVRTRLEELESVLLFGRYDRCHVARRFAAEDGVSRVHAGLIARGDAVYVVDIASTNGTTILDARGAEVADVHGLGARVHRLGASEVVRIGAQTLRVDLTQEMAETGST